VQTICRSSIPLSPHMGHFVIHLLSCARSLRWASASYSWILTHGANARRCMWERYVYGNFPPLNHHELNITMRKPPRHTALHRWSPDRANATVACKWGRQMHDG
jgi:hypothetical protein